MQLFSACRLIDWRSFLANLQKAAHRNFAKKWPKNTAVIECEILALPTDGLSQRINNI
jgi:hypothetical protein